MAMPQRDNAIEEIKRLEHLEIPGRDPKKSRNLIAVLCCFCEWIDFWRFVRFRVGVEVVGVGGEIVWYNGAV